MYKIHNQSIYMRRKFVEVSKWLELTMNLQDFLVEGAHQMFCRGPLFDGQNEILLLGKALKFGVIFQKISLKLIKMWKNY